MFENKKKLFGWILALSVIAGFTSCNKEETVLDEWTSNYVYLERPHLGIDVWEFNQSQTSLGLAGDLEINIPVTVKLVEPADCDVKVTLSFKQKEGVVPTEAASFKNGGVLTIPAGKLSASDELVFSQDWSKYYTSAAAVSSFVIKIESIEPESDQLRLSVNHSELGAVINKEEKKDLIETYPDGEKLPKNEWKSWWTTRSTPEGFVEVYQPIDNNWDSYLFSGGAFFYKIDLQKEFNVTGLELYSSFGGQFVTKAIEVELSSDGEEWTKITPEGGFEFASTSMFQRVKFAIPCKARFLRLHFLGSPALSNLEVFSK